MNTENSVPDCRFVPKLVKRKHFLPTFIRCRIKFLATFRSKSKFSGGVLVFGNNPGPSILYRDATICSDVVETKMNISIATKIIEFDNEELEFAIAFSVAVTSEPSLILVPIYTSIVTRNSRSGRQRRTRGSSQTRRRHRRRSQHTLTKHPKTLPPNLLASVFPDSPINNYLIIIRLFVFQTICQN
ncbi:hypothetical protein POM88_011777 [Heracleum sosnowskyi]|uniref:Uncharacterized protein n=1 Tax=Heracleum sosnowskyi TaxID=360622 RepID=A0AAD8IW37_9APIA|nr:hypothetical protein POM88_011777 [Heracleum sosnowskyi]